MTEFEYKLTYVKRKTRRFMGYGPTGGRPLPPPVYDLVPAKFHSARCPYCHQTWLAGFADELCDSSRPIGEITPCRHLRFFHPVFGDEFGQSGATRFFGSWDSAGFVREYRRIDKRDDGVLHDNLTAVRHPDVGSILCWEPPGGLGMALFNPYLHYWGVKRGGPEEPGSKGDRRPGQMRLPFPAQPRQIDAGR